MLQTYPVRSGAPEVVLHFLRITGAGAANPTKNYGPGMTVTWISTGRYKVTFNEAQGVFIGVQAQYATNAPAAGNGQLINVDRDSAGSTSFEFFIEDPGTDAVANALADLASTDSVFMVIAYKTTSV